MLEDLKTRLEELRKDLLIAEAEARPAVLDRLEDVVTQLETHGGKVPAWAREEVEARTDGRVEDQFDNMPV
ncbi:hypothetical protein [Pseudoponticoccus marisrubri]|uniref:Uncharacterized protein n=1 Tax=Pseudoponticoccus marisrubri TaxID=1685382 RepID=A0A0W7WI37_9RHOB|nr:hypothetical protein [Pseudoponticoccus marisrubri]KUF10288.1 hypothetical protein AVJ23_12840 [Pseudoponticoccus marisrubri]